MESRIEGEDTMTPALLVALAQVIFTGISAMQQLFPKGGGKGQFKADFVTNSANNLLNAWQIGTTGGAQRTAQEYAPVVQALLQGGVKLLGSDPVTGTPPLALPPATGAATS
jgi:hypothetical protein